MDPLNVSSSRGSGCDVPVSSCYRLRVQHLRSGLGACVGLSLLLTIAAGCGNGRTDARRQRSDPPRAESATAPPSTPATPAAPDTHAAAEVDAVESWDAAGIAIARLPDGSIRVRGEDRWGVRIDTTYADVTYFANAVPVISRSLSDPQSHAMAELVPRVRAAVAPAGAMP